MTRSTTRTKTKTPSARHLTRRGFLYGLGGTAVAQAEGEEPEQFWPHALGPVTKELLTTTDADRAVAELAEFADKLLLVRGTRFAFPGNGCGHSGGGNQVLTAAKVSVDPMGNKSLAMGESVDNRIARELNKPAQPEPLALYAGAMGGYINEVLSYRGAKDLRPADRNPWSVYTKMVGITDLPEEIIMQIKARRTPSSTRWPPRWTTPVRTTACRSSSRCR